MVEYWNPQLIGDIAQRNQANSQVMMHEPCEILETHKIEFGIEIKFEQPRRHILNYRVRVAPSPTGPLHIGTARTTLINYLFKEKYGGRLILRLEDTDPVRSRPEYEQDIIDNLRWLGLDWEEGPDIDGDFGPYRQSERMHMYEPFVRQLIESGHLYPCYCTSEELGAHRRLMQAQGGPLVYSGRCRNLTERERAQLEHEGRKPAWRFQVSETFVEFTDLIHGPQHFDMSLVGDFILVNSDGNVLFLLSNVVDDYTMQLDPVIRGDDHLPNTPRQILIYQALDIPIPQFGHLPLILNPDRTKMSKRQGGTTVQEYREAGFLPEALINYLALLGWTPDETREFFTLDELVSLFDLHSLGQSPSGFDKDRLNWMNGAYIRSLEPGDLAGRLLPFFAKHGLIADPPTNREMMLVHQIAPLVQERLQTLDDVSEWASFFFKDHIEVRPDMFPSNISREDMQRYLQETQYCLEGVEPFVADTISSALNELVSSLHTSKRKLFMTVRVAVSGSIVSPPLYESLEILGRSAVLARLKEAENAFAE